MDPEGNTSAEQHQQQEEEAPATATSLENTAVAPEDNTVSREGESAVTLAPDGDPKAVEGHGGDADEASVDEAQAGGEASTEVEQNAEDNDLTPLEETQPADERHVEQDPLRRPESEHAEASRSQSIQGEAEDNQDGQDPPMQEPRVPADDDVTEDVSSDSKTDGEARSTVTRDVDDVAKAMSEAHPGLQYLHKQTVKLVDDQGDATGSEVSVYVFHTGSHKPFVGGFRNKRDGTVYHHAGTQTNPKFKNDGKQRFHRTTQTAILRTEPKFATQSTVSTSTQMTKEGVFVTSNTDKVLLPRPYTPAHIVHQRLVEKVVIIQKYFRRWKAQRFVADLRYARQQYEEWQKAKEQAELEQDEREHQRNIQRRVDPKSAADFELLHAGLEEWRQKQDEAIRALPPDQQRQARVNMLSQECEYLQTIDRMKAMAATETHEKKIDKFFDQAAAPREWVEPVYQKKTQMETPTNQRAKMLRDVYHLIKMTDISTDERLDALLQLKLTVEPFQHRLSKEILSLIQREAELVSRGVKRKNLEGLRRRILNLYVQLCQNADFNPEAARLLREHAEPSDLAAEQKQQENKVDTWITHKRQPAVAQDLTHYKRILKEAQQSEHRMDDRAQCIFLMSASDIKYLVDKVWLGKSALSGEDRLYRLVLVRWHKSAELSPWNCLLLSVDEAEQHQSADDPERLYGRGLVSMVNQRHLQAKAYFGELQSHLLRAKKQLRNKRVPRPSAGFARGPTKAAADADAATSTV